MADVFHYYGSDLSVSPSGDLALASGSTMGTQRVYRRLLTNPALNDAAGNSVASADYMSHPEYGAGLPRKVGSPGNAAAIRSLIKGQMLLEDAVARTPAPRVTLTENDTTVSAVVSYADANTAQQQFLEFDINK